MTHSTPSLAWTIAALLSSQACLSAQSQVQPTEMTSDLEIVDATVRLSDEIGALVFEQRVRGTAGSTKPAARGGMDGAPVLGYVFPTTLKPEDVGFESGEGVVALAATSHPDFDDTPLWDENGDLDSGNDGLVFHTHWVVLVPDSRVPGGLAVKETASTTERLPATNPGMPMYLDSPGFSVVLRGSHLRVVVPLDRVSGRDDFRFDAVSAYMEVNTSDEARPMLGVYQVYGVLSGDLSLPYSVTRD